MERNGENGKASQKDIEAEIDWLIGMFGFFESILHFGGKGLDLDQKFFSHDK